MAKAGEGYTFRISLFDSSGDIVDSPTLAAGDVVVVKNDQTSANITSLPTEATGNSKVLVVSLSAAEMAGSAGGNVVVVFEDQAGDEWESVVVDIELTTQDVDDVASAADLATVDGNVDAILVDTGTTLPAALAVVDGNVDLTLVNLGGMDLKLDDILLDTSVDGVVVAGASKTGYALSDAGVDAVLDEVVEGAYTMRQFLRLFAAALLGEASGGGTTTITFRDTGDATDRIVATVDSDGNRSAVVLDAS